MLAQETDFVIERKDSLQLLELLQCPTLHVGGREEFLSRDLYSPKYWRRILNLLIEGGGGVQVKAAITYL